jgi:lipoprotein-anchoring transpeptidase ErfK/SrfK
VRRKYRITLLPSPVRWAVYLLLLIAIAIGAWVLWPRGRPKTPARVERATPVLRVTVVPAPSLPLPTALPTNPPSPPAPVIVRQPATQTTLEPVPARSSPRPPRDVFEAQLALDRQGISSGSLDGLIGPQTRAALRAFQEKEHLSATGELDAATKVRLVLNGPACTTYTVTSNDLARLQPLSSTWLGKSQQTALDYETVLELVAEKGHSHPNLIRRLNPSTAWTNVLEGTTVRLPDVACAGPETKAAFATISLSGKMFEAFDANTNLLAHFPCSIARRVEKRPVGELHVAVIAPNPNYTFDPDVFPESEEARQMKTKLILPPGPNNPVGVAWVGLDKPGYGIHGTPSPEQVGRTESHGCFRLANWNAEYLVKLAWIGMPVYIEP